MIRPSKLHEGQIIPAQEVKCRELSLKALGQAGDLQSTVEKQERLRLVRRWVFQQVCSQGEENAFVVYSRAWPTVTSVVGN